MDYIAFCKKYFSATSIPVNLFHKNVLVYSSIAEILSFEPVHVPELFPSSRNPEFCFTTPDIEFGRVIIEGSEYQIIVGPAFSIPVTESIVRTYMHEYAIPLSYFEELTEYLCAIPRTTHLQFANHLLLLHMCLNNKECSVHDFFMQVGIEHRNIAAVPFAEPETSESHNAYHIEQELYRHVRGGNAERLRDFLATNTLASKEGRLANTPLRHAKNLLISLASKVGVLAAIPSGVDAEKTYHMIDSYVQKCEQLQSIKDVKTLQYSMLLDFCQQVSEADIPDGISVEVYTCINYIRSHTNETVRLSDVAEQVHRSVSYVAKSFKAQLGVSINAFIVRCKLEDARKLLAYSDKNLADISNFLSFSSQSHFQNTFKKEYGLTPMQYRKQQQRL